MEFQIQKPQQKEKETGNKMKSKNKFIGVRQRPSGKWVAEIKNTTQKIRIWLGTFDTAEEAAHAYDEAACLLRGSNTRTNFTNTPSSANSALSRRIRNLVNQKRMLINNSQPTPTPPTTTPSIIKPADNTSFVSFTGECQMPDLFDYSWAFPQQQQQQQQFPPPGDLGMFTKQVSFTTTLTEAGGLMTTADEVAMLEFERIKVERQISASFYAMNGVSDYLQSVIDAYNSIDHDPAAPTWDPPTLYHNFCLG